MKIMPIQLQNSKTSFKSCDRIYNPKTLKAINVANNCNIRTFTNILRYDLDWVQLIKYLDCHFAQQEKVNVYSMACSDGSEPFSLAIMILDYLPKKVQDKFIPIMASDIDEKIINVAKSGRINLYPVEFLAADNHCEVNLFKYLKNKGHSVAIDGDYMSESDYISSYKIVDEVLNKVNFKNSDILTEIENINDNGNTVIMCRNVFPYLKQDYMDNIIKTAKEKLKPNSLFIIGDFDENAKTSQKLLHNGFYNPLPNYLNIFVRGDNHSLYNKLLSGRLL